MIWHLRVARAVYPFGTPGSALGVPGEEPYVLRRVLRGPAPAGTGETRGPRVSSPPCAEALTVSSRARSGWDSDLEAFSHNPPDGSLAPLAYQPSA